MGGIDLNLLCSLDDMSPIGTFGTIEFSVPSDVIMIGFLTVRLLCTVSLLRLANHTG